MEDTVKVIDLSPQTDLISVETECPKCGDKYNYGVPYVNVPCRKCGITYRTDFKQDIYTKKGRHILYEMAFNDEVKFNVREKYEASAALIHRHLNLFGSFDLTPITRKNEEYKKCFNCGVCLSCYTCKNCGKAFPKETNLKKQICKQCGSNSFIKTYFKEVLTSDKNKEIRLCPHCKSDNIKMTRTKNKTTCHLCNSDKLSETRTNVNFQFTWSRKKAYRLENLPEE